MFSGYTPGLKLLLTIISGFLAGFCGYFALGISKFYLAESCRVFGVIYYIGFVWYSFRCFALLSRLYDMHVRWECYRVAVVCERDTSPLVATYASELISRFMTGWFEN